MRAGYQRVVEGQGKKRGFEEKQAAKEIIFSDADDLMGVFSLALFSKNIIRTFEFKQHKIFILVISGGRRDEKEESKDDKEGNGRKRKKERKGRKRPSFEKRKERKILKKEKE